MQQKTLTEFSTTGVSCPTCERDDFKNTHGMRIHHAQAHGERLGVVEKECVICGDSYETITIRADGSKYCSNECKHEGRRSRVTIECEWCGDEFEVHEYRSDQTFCSEGCHNEWMRSASPEEGHAYQGGKATLECEWCGDSFSVKRFRESEARACSYECMGQLRSREFSGENHPNYRGGGARRFYEAVRRALSDDSWQTIRERHDREQCAMCDRTVQDDGRALMLHHIIPVLSGGTNDSELLMPLCSKHHRTVEQYTWQFAPRILVELGDEPTDAA